MSAQSASAPTSSCVKTRAIERVVEREHARLARVGRVARGQVAQRGGARGRRGVEGAAMYEARGVPGVRVRERRVQSERADVSVERGVKLFPVVMSVPPCEERGSSVRRVVHTLSLLVEQRGQPQQS